MILLLIAFLAHGETVQPTVAELLKKNETAIYQAIDAFKLAKQKQETKDVQNQLQDVIIELMEQHRQLEKLQ